MHGWEGLGKLTIMVEGEENMSFFTWQQQGEVQSKGPGDGPLIKALIKASDLVRTHSLL